jgi:acyl-CoA dehydrogenase
MRLIGAAERALALHVLRATDPDRKPFGKFIHELGDTKFTIAQSRIDINAARLLVLEAAVSFILIIRKGKD